jgi:hypothetical protein
MDSKGKQNTLKCSLKKERKKEFLLSLSLPSTNIPK